jgi:hypothetical protein
MHFLPLYSNDESFLVCGYTKVVPGPSRDKIATTHKRRGNLEAFTGKTSSFAVAAITHASPTWRIFLQICALYAHVKILTEKPFQTVLQAQ